MSNSSERHRLADAEFAEVLTLIKDADSVELKLTVPTLLRRAMVIASVGTAAGAKSTVEMSRVAF